MLKKHPGTVLYVGRRSYRSFHSVQQCKQNSPPKRKSPATFPSSSNIHQGNITSSHRIPNSTMENIPPTLGDREVMARPTPAKQVTKKLALPPNSPSPHNRFRLHHRPCTPPPTVARPLSRQLLVLFQLQTSVLLHPRIKMQRRRRKQGARHRPKPD